MIYDSEGTSFYEGDWIDNKKFGWGIRHYPSGYLIFQKVLDKIFV